MASRASLKTTIDTNLGTSSGIVTKVKHKIIDDAIVDSLAPYNRGTITVGEIPITVKTYTSSGDISSAICSTVATGILCTMANAMPSTNYLVRLHIQSLGTLATDGILFPAVFSIVSTTQFRFTVIEYSSSQNIKMHVEVISLD